jgi:hypothetical protein
MAARGGQEGNDNAQRRGQWARALQRAIAQDDGLRLRNAVDKLLHAAAAGEDWAIKELGDRLDGKPGQAVIVQGDSEQPLQTIVTMRYVDADSGDRHIDPQSPQVPE